MFDQWSWVLIKRISAPSFATMVEWIEHPARFLNTSTYIADDHHRYSRYVQSFPFQNRFSPIVQNAPLENFIIQLSLERANSSMQNHSNPKALWQLERIIFNLTVTRLISISNALWLFDLTLQFLDYQWIKFEEKKFDHKKTTNDYLKSNFHRKPKISTNYGRDKCFK